MCKIACIKIRIENLKIEFPYNVNDEALISRIVNHSEIFDFLFFQLAFFPKYVICQIDTRTSSPYHNNKHIISIFYM